MRSRLLYAFGIAIFFGLSVGGCNAPPPKTAVAPSPVSGIPTVNRSASFAPIVAAYRAGAYRDALTRVETLSKSPTLSAADRLYLDKQAAICRAALTKPAAPVRVAATPAPAVADCGPRALLLICRDLDVPASLPALTRAAQTRPGIGSNLAGLTSAAKSVGLTATGVQVDLDALRRAPTPAIAWVDGNHFVTVSRIENNSATVQDPNKPGKETLALPTLLQRSGGVLLLVKRKN